MDIVTQKHVACGDFPVVIAVVYINPKGFAFIAAAEANALSSGLEKLQISKERVRQIERQAMEKLQKNGESLGLEDFLNE